MLTLFYPIKNAVLILRKASIKSNVNLESNSVKLPDKALNMQRKLSIYIHCQIKQNEDIFGSAD